MSASAWTHDYENERWINSWTLEVQAEGPPAPAVWLVITIRKQGATAMGSFRAEAAVRTLNQDLGGTLNLGVFISLEEAKKESVRMVKRLGQSFQKIEAE